MADPLAAIPLSALRVFEAAARLGSFTRAAEALGVSQAAVSWQVKALEQRLGQPLFRRLPREVALTPAGERLARAAGEAMATLRSALEDLMETSEGVLQVTSVQTLATQWLAPRLGAFQLKHPEIAVRLNTSTRIVDLPRGEADVALRLGSGAWEGVDSVRLFPSLLTPLCAPSVAAELSGTPQDLLTRVRIGDPDEWALWFAAAGIADSPRGAGVAMTADAQGLEIAAALAEGGVALGSPILWSREIAAGRLVQPFETVVRWRGGYWLAFAKDRGRTRKIQAFKTWIMDCVAQDPSVARWGGELELS